VGRESLVLPLVAEYEEVWRMTLDVLARLLVYSFSPQDMQSEPRIGSQQALVRDGSNIGDVLRRLDEDKSEIDWIVRHLTSVTRGITQIQASVCRSSHRDFFPANGQAGEPFCRIGHVTWHFA